MPVKDMSRDIMQDPQPMFQGTTSHGLVVIIGRKGIS